MLNRAIFDDTSAQRTFVVQCLQVKALQSKQPAADGMDRYRLILSDVDNFIQSMLATRKANHGGATE